MFGVLPVTSGDVYTVRSPLSSTVPHDGGDGAMLWKGTNLNFSTLVAVGGPGGGGASAVNYLPGIGGPGQCPDITGNGGDGYFNLLSAKVAVGGGGGASYAYGHGGVRPFGAVPPAAICLDGTDGLGGPGGNVSQGGVNAGRGGRGYYQGGSAAECSNPASGSNSAGGGGAGSSFWHYISLFPGDPRPNADLMATQCYPGAGWAAANGNDPDYHYPYGAGGLPTSNPGEWRGGSGAAVIWLQADRQAVESDDWFPGAWSWTDACSVAVAHDFPGTSVLMTNPPCAPPYSSTMTCRQAWDRVWDRVCNYVCHDPGPHQNQTMRFRVGC